MLNEICRSIRNYFPTRKHESGSFAIENGAISLPFVSEGGYFLIEGSLLNDGIHKYPATDLVDEEFNGVITLCAVPKSFEALVAEIEDYKAKNAVSPYASESFGGYSYTRATNARGNVASWQDTFSTRLNAWRKL